MATEREQENKFFAFNKKKPMKFTIMQGKMLRIKCNQYSKMITDHGGIVIDYEEKDDECIVLAHRQQPSTKPEMYDIRYVKDCISQNKVLNFLDYRICSNPKYKTVAKKARREAVNNLVENNPSKRTCAFAEKVLMNKQCIHRVNRSAESILKIIQEKYVP